MKFISSSVPIKTIAGIFSQGASGWFRESIRRQADKSGVSEKGREGSGILKEEKRTNILFSLYIP